jgi:hypothetical protein
MSTRKDSARKAARAAKSAVSRPTADATPVAKSHKPTGAKAVIRKLVSHWTSLAVTTVLFAGMVAITLAFDKYVFHYLFYEFAAGADPVLVFLLKSAKYLAVFVELAFFVYGVYTECKHHRDE